MYRLYYTTRSYTTESTSLIPRIALEELGLPYDVEEVELSPKPPEWYLAYNRYGQIPTLAMPTEQGHPLHISPSPAILLALADAHPNNVLLPETAHERAKCYAWLFDMVEKLHTCYMQIFNPERYSPRADDADAIKLASCEALSRYFAFMNDTLSQQANVCGNNYTLCDIYFYVMARWHVDISPMDGLRPMQDLQSIQSFCDRMEQRPAVATSLSADEIAPLANALDANCDTTSNV